LIQAEIFLAAESAGEEKQEGVFAVVEFTTFVIEQLRDLRGFRGYPVGSFAEVDGLRACYCMFANKDLELCGKLLEGGEVGQRWC
jgi:hypothetical protein